MVRKRTQQQIGGAATVIGVISVIVVLYVYWDGQAAQYNYSFDGRTGKPPINVLSGDKSFYEVPVYAINKGKTDGNVTLTVTALDATFTGPNGVETWSSYTYTKKATVGDGWTGNAVFVRPNPGATQFTLTLTGSPNETLSDHAGADPTRIIYKQTSSNWWQLQPY